MEYFFNNFKSYLTWHGYNLRDPAAQDFLNLVPHDLVLLDRGYPSFWLFNLIIARIFSKNLTWILAFPAKSIIQKDDENRTCSYQINFAQALVSTKNSIMLMFSSTTKLVRKIIADLTELFSKIIEPIKPGRKFVRNPELHRNYCVNYKPIG